MSGMSGTLNELVDVFKCCILTWDFLPVVLPAFLLAGAIAVFVPVEKILKYVGYRANRLTAYLAACFSGFVISMCSCNIVPIAYSIYRRGAGIGPAIAFLYSGPAINIVTLAWTFQVIGVKMGIWRTVAVPVIGTVVGLLMQLLFYREERERRDRLLSEDTKRVRLLEARGSSQSSSRRVAVVFGLLLGVLILGAKGLPWAVRIPAMVIFGGALVFVLRNWFSAQEVKEWLLETLRFMKMVLPILLPTVLVIAYISRVIPIRWVEEFVSDNSARSTFTAATFGSLMYFPILTEIAFTKAFLKQGMAVGPALAILLNGPGVSLPGALLLGRIFGWKKMLVYEVLEIGLGGLVALTFGKMYGDYVCPCQTGVEQEPKTALVLTAVIILIAALIVAYFLVPKPKHRAKPSAPKIGTALAGDGE